MRTVIITAIGSFSAGAVIKGCREAGFRVVGTDINPAEYLAESAETDRFVRVPRYDAGDAYVRAIGRIAREEGAEGIIALTDAELDILSERREECFPAALWASPEEAVRRARDKRESARIAERVFSSGAGEAPGRFRTIPTCGLRGEEEAELEERLPLALKPYDGRSSEGLYRVRTAEELREALRAIRERGREKDYLVQPLIPGRVVCVDTVRSRSGEAVALPREEYRRTANGAGLSVRVFRDPELERVCGALSEALGILGCVNYEFIHGESGSYYFLECNPRFAGGTGFSVSAGCDVVRQHVAVFCNSEESLVNEAAAAWIAKKYIEVIIK